MADWIVYRICGRQMDRESVLWDALHTKTRDVHDFLCSVASQDAEQTNKLTKGFSSHLEMQTLWAMATIA